MATPELRPLMKLDSHSKTKMTNKNIYEVAPKCLIIERWTESQ